MKIYAFVEYYPSAYKAYYDAQFADLVRKGNDLHIFAIGCLDSIIDGKVAEYRLHDRTHYFYPDDLRSIPRFLRQLVSALAKAPHVRVALAARVFAAERGRNRAKTLVKAFARMLTLPSEPPDLCLVNSHRTMSLVPWLKDVYPGARVALYYHGGEPKESGRLDDGRTRTAFAAADLVFTPTRFARDEAVNRGADPSRTHVLPVGFEIDDYRPPNLRRYRRGGVLRLVSAGRLSEGKGHLAALEAISRLIQSGMRDIEYRIVGDGYMRSRLDEFIRGHGLEKHVRFEGTLSNRKLIEALGDSDVLILSSKSEGTWTETQGAVVQEALLMKALAVTTRTGGVPESIPDALRVFSAPENDIDALTHALTQVYVLSEDDFERLGRECRSWVTARYDISLLMGELLAHARRDEREAVLGKSKSAAARSPATIKPLTR